MKLKNSYILLIAISILLLISIGSVCASEHSATDSDVKLTSDKTDVILSANADNNAALTDDTTEGETQEKINTSVSTDFDTKEFEYDEDKNITVNILDNNSENIEGINRSNLTVFEGEKQINFTYNNSILTITDKLSVGNHSLIINYLGNANYTNSSKTVLLSILGNRTLNAPETVVSDGTLIVIPVSVFDGVKDVDLIKNKFYLNLTYIDENGNITSKIIEQSEFDLENNTLKIRNALNLISASVLVNYTDAINTRRVAVKLATTVDADDIKKTEKDVKNLTVEVKYGGTTLIIKQSDLRVLENGKEIAFTYANSTITFNSLAVGVHNLTIVYKGNETYNSSSKSIIYKVSGDLRIDPDKTANVDENKKVNITINLNDGADPVDINLDNLTGILYYKHGNETYNRTINDITLNGQVITFSVSEDFTSAYVILKYKAENNLTANVTIKIDTKINAPSEITVGDNETIKFPIYVTSSNGTVINITDSNLKIFNGDKQLNITYNNGTITINDKLTYGNYNLTIKFIGDSIFSNAEHNLLLKVYGFNMNTTSVNVNSTLKGEIKINNITDGVTNYTVTIDELNITITYQDGNVTKNITAKEIKFVNNTITFELENGNFTKASMIIQYRNATTTVALNRIFNIKIEVINNVAEYQTGNFTYKLVDTDTNESLANKTVKLTYSVSSQSITFQQTIQAKTNDEGIVVFKNKDIFVSYFNLVLDVGNHTVTLSGDGLVINGSSQKVSITKATVKMVISPYKEYYGSKKQVIITVTNAKTGDPVKFTSIHLYMKDSSAKHYYFSTDENGTSKINVTGLVGGSYPITISNNDTKNINPTSAKGTIVILRIPVKINAKNTVVFYNTGASSTIKITKSGKAVSGAYVLVRIYHTSKKYKDYLFQTNKKGVVSFSASLGVGKHKIIIKTADNRYEAKDLTRYITVKKATGKLSAPKVAAYCKEGKYFTIKLTNTKNKKPIYDARLNIKIWISKTRYYNYNGNTGSNGKLKLLIDLKPGTYNVDVSGASKKNFTAKAIKSKIVVKKTPTKLTPKKLVAKKGTKNYFKVTAKNKKTKKPLVGLKLKVKVYTGKKSKTFTIKTNNKGLAKLNTKSLKVGTHKVVIKSGYKYCVGKAAKSTIKIKK